MHEGDGYHRALALLGRAAGPIGFVASLEERANYGRVWARDGVVDGLAALASGDEELIEALARTLETLRACQGPHGEIPSNVALDGTVSYGTLAGRADAPLWYVIGCAALALARPEAAGRHEAAIRRALDLVAAWELNRRGLVYVPLGGCWADEYVLHGYVLGVELLYLWALRSAAAMFGEDDLERRAERLAELVRANYWLEAGRNDAYHPHGFGRALAEHGRSCYWAASFHPGGYQTMFDALANGLALLLGLGHADEVAAFVAEFADTSGSDLLPAYAPPIEEGDPAWSTLASYHVYDFRNHPGEYWNGGLWPVTNGFLAAGLAAANHTALASRVADAIDDANARDDWGFREFHHGRTHEPLGARHTAWSAAAAVIARRAVEEGGLSFAPRPAWCQ